MRSPSGPGKAVGETIGSALGAVLGERLRYIGRAADLVWVGIGQDVETTDRRGGPRVRAEHALHLQCPWRLTRFGVPFIGSEDLYRAIGSNESADGELLHGEAAFDPAAEALTADADRSEHLVERVVGDDWGGFSMEFSNGLVLDVLPVTTASDECWRYFKPGEDGKHLVVFEVPEAALVSNCDAK